MYIKEREIIISFQYADVSKVVLQLHLKILGAIWRENLTSGYYVQCFRSHKDFNNEVENFAKRKVATEVKTA